MQIWAVSSKTTLFITHSVDEALLLGDRLLVMTAHPGRVEAVSSMTTLPRPRDMISLRGNPASSTSTGRSGASCPRRCRGRGRTGKSPHLDLTGPIDRFSPAIPDTPSAGDPTRIRPLRESPM
jgi:hypothetical protein